MSLPLLVRTTIAAIWRWLWVTFKQDNTTVLSTTIRARAFLPTVCCNAACGSHFPFCYLCVCVFAHVLAAGVRACYALLRETLPPPPLPVTVPNVKGNDTINDNSNKNNDTIDIDPVVLQCHWWVPHSYIDMSAGSPHSQRCREETISFFLHSILFHTFCLWLHSVLCCSGPWRMRRQQRPQWRDDDNSPINSTGLVARCRVQKSRGVRYQPVRWPQIPGREDCIDIASRLL